MSIYGPSVYLKFPEEIMKDCKENLFHSLKNIVTCSLYTLCGAVKTGFKSSIMNVKKTVKRFFSNLDNTPACLDDYENVTGSKKYSLDFCPTGWKVNWYLAIYSNDRTVLSETAEI